MTWVGIVFDNGIMSVYQRVFAEKTHSIPAVVIFWKRDFNTFDHLGCLLGHKLFVNNQRSVFGLFDHRKIEIAFH